MRLIRFVASISYKDISKLCSILWVEGVFENLLNAVVQEFQIPPNEATEKILCDLDGTSLTKDSFEDYVCRSISEARVPQFRVITLPLSDNTITSSTNLSQFMGDVEQQVPEETDLRSIIRNLFPHMSRFEDNLMGANRLRPYEIEIELNNQGESNEQRVDIDGLQRALENRQVNLDFFRRTRVLQSNNVTSSTNGSECREADEQQEPQGTNLRSTIRRLFSHLTNDYVGGLQRGQYKRWSENET